LSLSLRSLSSLLLFAAFQVASWSADTARAAPTSADAGPGAILAAPAGTRVESMTAMGFRVVVPIPAPEVLHGVVFGQPLDEIKLPGGSLDSPAGAPQLPSLTLLLRVPRGVEPRVTFSAGGERSLGMLRPEPLPHLLSDRDLWSSFDAKRLSAYLGSERYAPSGARGTEAPLASYRTTAAGEERLVHVVLRPVRWDPRSGRAAILDQVTIDVSWSGAPSAAAGLPAPRAGARGLAYSGPFRVEPNRPWVRLGVVRLGLYALSATDLAAAGVSVAGIDPASFRLFRATPGDLPESVAVDTGPDSLRECAIVVTGEGDGTFDSGDRLYFYGTGQTGFGYDLALGGSANYQEAQRSDEEPLWLTWGPFPSVTSPKRMTVRDAAPVTPAPTITSVTYRVHYEENRIRDFNSFATNVRWERWFYRIFAQGSRIAFPLTLPGAQPGGQGSLFLRMWGRGISVGSIPDHFTNLYWDGALVASGSWDQSTPKDLTASGFTVHASDTLQVEVPRMVDLGGVGGIPDPNRFDQSELAWFEVTYPRRLSAINDTLLFESDSVLTGPVHYVVDGITDTTAVWLLDRTDPENPVRYVNGSYSGTTAPFTLTAEDSIAPGLSKRYALVSTARAARPAAIARYLPASSGHTIDNLLDSSVGVDYLIVVHPSLLASAESLAIYRSSTLHGYASPRVGIATTDRIAAQLGGGYLDPVAIRNLLAHARLHWTAPAPAFVCLFGDASLDPKNYLGFNTPDLTPTYANYYDVSLNAQFVTDDFYGLLDGPGDLLLDIAVGRLPVRSALDASTIVRGKIPVYEGSTEFDEWRARALLCADDARKRDELDGLGNIHVKEMERKDRFHIPYPIERSKVYLNDYAFSDTLRQAKPAARDDFIARINQGNWFTDYIGHGSDLFLADEQVLRSSDIGRLSNASRPSLFGFFSCTVGRFDALGQEGLAELLLKSPTGGAVASLASTELVYSEPSTELNDEFMDQLFPLRPRVDSTSTVGQAFQRAKNLHVNPVTLKYVLLGDPGLAPPIPRGRGVWEKAPLDSLLRGDLAVIRGHALAPDSSADTLSAGRVRIQVQGKPFTRTQTGLRDIGGFETISYQVPGPILFRGEVPLSGGTFEARFVVPLDARIAGGAGQLRALLSAAGGRGVGLAVDSIRIGQGLSSRTDLTPPTITLLYTAGPDSSFKPGDRVTFAIQDSSGIDLMRLDNAHTIFVILDDRGSPVELTQGFVYDPGSYTRGTVVYTLPQLPEGLHTVEVHASDTFGNIAVRSFVLDVHSTVLPGDPMQLTQVFNYPNPFEGQTYIHARLNQAGAIRVRILTVAGRRVRELSADGRAGENYLPWDGKDSQGENVAIGVYLIKVTAETPQGKRASALGRALRKR
jgi:hypothetical protein